MQEQALSDIFIAIDRIRTGNNTCLGVLNFNKQFTNFTLEDPPRKKKIDKITAIPEGIRQVKLRYEGGMYNKYTKAYGESHPMLWLQDVPGFEWIYFHPLNFHYQTDGCIGTGDRFLFDKVGNDFSLLNSKMAYDEMYFPTRLALEAGKEVFVEIRTLILKKKTIIILNNQSLKKAVPKEVYYKTGLKLLPTTGAIEIDKDQLSTPWYHFYKKTGFKRVTGLVIGVGALILKAVAPELGIVVDVIGLTGGGILSLGGVDAIKKNKEKNRTTYVDNSKLLSKLADWAIKIAKFIINRFIKK